MGWNSYDYYDTTVTEDAVKANADYMAAHLKEFGWEYIVVDIEWYAIGAGSRCDQFQYIPFADVAMDEFSRLRRIRHVFHLLRTEPVLPTLLTISTVSV